MTDTIEQEIDRLERIKIQSNPQYYFDNYPCAMLVINTLKDKLETVRSTLEFAQRYLPDGCNAAEDDINKALFATDLSRPTPKPESEAI